MRSCKPTGSSLLLPNTITVIPASLKAVLDLLLREYIHKAVAFVGVSAGPWGGTRVIEAMVPMCRELGLAVTLYRSELSLVCKRLSTRKANYWTRRSISRVKDFLDELVWMSTVLKWGRANVPSKFHT